MSTMSAFLTDKPSTTRVNFTSMSCPWFSSTSRDLLRRGKNLEICSRRSIQSSPILATMTKSSRSEKSSSLRLSLLEMVCSLQLKHSSEAWCWLSGKNHLGMVSRRSTCVVMSSSWSTPSARRKRRKRKKRHPNEANRFQRKISQSQSHPRKSEPLQNDD